MRAKVLNILLTITVLGFSLNACIEQFEVETISFEDVLVVEATITNEMKQHKIQLSRSVNLENVNKSDSIPYNPFIPIRPPEDNTVYETNANVTVSDNQGNTYAFFEQAPGQYFSENEFAAQKGIKYSLVITTKDGVTYSSEPEEFNSESVLQDVFAERELNDQGVDGISIYINSNDSNNEAEYFRYEYEETYKIIAPEWTPLGFRLTNYDPCALPVITYDLEIIEREQEEQICYNTVKSSRVVQNSTSNLQGSRIERFPIRFIEGDDFILSHRYSILVKQYVQSLNAYSYYQALGNFSVSESVFSEVQPGFLNGNISVVGNPDKRVLGYFEVSSVSTKRLFFDYVDFFPNEPLPAYPFNCNYLSAPLEHPSYCLENRPGNPCPQSILERINLGLISYIGDNGGNIGSCPGPYVFVPRICGDCTVLGSNEVPEFWEE